MERFTETREIGVGENLGGSLTGMLFGLALIIGAVAVLWWNESSSVDKADALRQLRERVVSLESPEPIPANEGKAVLISGRLAPIDRVEDPVFRVAPEGALVLKRQVEMYQWQERKEVKKEEKLGGGTTETTTYTYTKGWYDGPVDSKAFRHPSGHENPPFLYRGRRFEAQARLGGFDIDGAVTGRIDPTQRLEKLPEPPAVIDGLRRAGDFYYVGKDPANPEVGDLKIAFVYAPEGPFTILGRQSGKKIAPYEVDGYAFLFVQRGRAGADEILEAALDENSLITWLFRFGGLLLMFFGFLLMAGPLQALANIVPFVGSLIGGATALVAGILTLIFGSLVIALAWIGARPWVLGVLAALLAGWLIYRRRSPSGGAVPPPRR